MSENDVKAAAVFTLSGSSAQAWITATSSRTTPENASYSASRCFETGLFPGESSDSSAPLGGTSESCTTLTAGRSPYFSWSSSSSLTSCWKSSRSRRGSRSVYFDAYLFLLLLFPFQLSFFLGAKQGLFLLFPFAFIFTSPVTHICSSLFENECFS